MNIEKYVSVAEMIAIEREADARGFTYSTMMQHAGENLAKAIEAIYHSDRDGGVLGLVGPGNNGGDTLVALTRLAHNGWRCSAYLTRKREPEDPLVVNLRLAGGQVHQGATDRELIVLRELLSQHSVVLDGIAGTGVHLPLKDELARLLDAVREIVRGLDHLHLVAVDCPSGVDCDSGQAPEECVPAELTVTMAAVKQGLLHFPAYNLVGKLITVGIGIDKLSPPLDSWDRVRRIVPNHSWVKGVLPKRPLDAHKGTFGTALVVAGSINYPGAAQLAGKAAYRVGAGLVTMAVTHPVYSALAGQFPEATWVILPDVAGAIAEAAATKVFEHLQRQTALLIGPGFGLHDSTAGFLQGLFLGENSTTMRGILSPLVVDADGLKLLTRIPKWHSMLPGESVLTPHPGEMSILTGVSKEQIQSERVAVAERYAREWGHVVVLKGAFSVVASPRGDTAIIPVATPALARAGTGDILSGLIVGLRAQGVTAWESAVAGAWIHAQAGLRAAENLGTTSSVLAGDILNAVPQVIAEMSSS